jgi:hypothetical protein
MKTTQVETINAQTGTLYNFGCGIITDAVYADVQVYCYFNGNGAGSYENAKGLYFWVIARGYEKLAVVMLDPAHCSIHVDSVISTLPDNVEKLLENLIRYVTFTAFGQPWMREVPHIHNRAHHANSDELSFRMKRWYGLPTVEIMDELDDCLSLANPTWYGYLKTV